MMIQITLTTRCAPPGSTITTSGVVGHDVQHDHLHDDHDVQHDHVSQNPGGPGCNPSADPLHRPPPGIFLAGRNRRG